MKLFKDNKEIKFTDRVAIKKADNSETKFAISFTNIEASDNGVYKLVASNKHGSVTSQADLVVTGSPFFVRKPNSTLSVPEKKPLKAEFEIGGIPVPEVSWYSSFLFFIHSSQEIKRFLQVQEWSALDERRQDQVRHTIENHSYNLVW